MRLRISCFAKKNQPRNPTQDRTNRSSAAKGPKQAKFSQSPLELSTNEKHEENLTVQKYKKLNILNSFFAFFCLILALGICWSRISLGSHSWEQVVLGALYGLLAIAWIDFQWLEKFIVATIRSNSLLILTWVITVGHVAYSIGTFFLSKSRLESFSNIIARPECPNCTEKILVSQGQNHS